MNEQPNKRRFSLATKWISLVALTITVSFVIFSFVIFSLVKNQMITQESKSSEEAIVTVRSRLESINQEMTVSSVVSSLSPETQRIIDGKAVLTGGNSPFDDTFLTSLSRRDMTVVIYNDENDIVFSTRSFESTINTKKTQSETLQTTKDGYELLTVEPVRSNRTNKIIGYVLVKNDMQNLNQILSRLRFWMFILAAIAIIVAVVVSYFVVNGVVRPLHIISNVARKVEKYPDADDRIPDLHRNDELGDLAETFNQMLARMQRYIDQQKSFVEDVSHELRTPVAVIEGHLNMLNRWGKDDPQILSESLDAALKETSRMKHLVQEMLDLTRAEQIDVLYPEEVTSVKEVVTLVVDNFRLLHPDFKIELDDDLKEGSRVQIYRNHLEQILTVLVDNAIKYSSNRKEVIVSAASDKENVKLVIQDFGEGISPEDRDKVFQRFYRVDKARTREKGGNGLGLPIAKKLVESYHGKIRIDSQVGSGTQFKITFPRYRSSHNKKTSTK